MKVLHIILLPVVVLQEQWVPELKMMCMIFYLKV